MRDYSRKTEGGGVEDEVLREDSGKQRPIAGVADSGEFSVAGTEVDLRLGSRRHCGR